jgi:dihydroneopterin aldolase
VSRDAIALRGIRAHGRHGANAGERDAAQPLDLDLELELDLSAARRSDDLRDTIDYDALHASVVDLVGRRSYRLLERLADEVAALVLADARVRAVSVTIAKPRLLAGATPSVTVRAARD